MIDAIELLYRMARIRRIEENISAKYSEQSMRCPTHLSIGQEAPAAVTGILLKTTDYAVSTHRGHAHYLAKGGDLKAMLSEIYGKQTGCSRGRGGSMHLIDLAVGFQGTTAIVGNSIPIGIGLGLACQLDGTSNLSCIFIGDGATEEGVFYESVNFAAVRHLPVLFICENNLYSVYSPLPVRQPVDRKIHELVAAMGVDSTVVDGNDALESYRVIENAIQLIREGRGPQFVELSTYRWLEHCGPNYDNDLPYRSENEFLRWKKKDPIELLFSRLRSENKMTIAKYDEMLSVIDNEITEAFAYAENSSFPDAREAYIDEYWVS